MAMRTSHQCWPRPTLYPSLSELQSLSELPSLQRVGYNLVRRLKREITMTCSRYGRTIHGRRINTRPPLRERLLIKVRERLTQGASRLCLWGKTTIRTSLGSRSRGILSMSNILKASRARKRVRPASSSSNLHQRKGRTTTKSDCVRAAGIRNLFLYSTDKCQIDQKEKQLKRVGTRACLCIARRHSRCSACRRSYWNRDSRTSMNSAGMPLRRPKSV